MSPKISSAGIEHLAQCQSFWLETPSALWAVKPLTSVREWVWTARVPALFPSDWPQLCQGSSGYVGLGGQGVEKFVGCDLSQDDDSPPSHHQLTYTEPPRVVAYLQAPRVCPAGGLMVLNGLKLLTLPPESCFPISSQSVHLSFKIQIQNNALLHHLHSSTVMQATISAFFYVVF